MLKTDVVEDRPSLSRREKEILELIASGLSAKEVAQEIVLAPRTVERHIENIRNKLRARNRAHLITKAVACGELMFVSPANPEDSRRRLEAPENDAQSCLDLA